MSAYLIVIFLSKISFRYKGTFSGLNFCAKYFLIQLGFSGYVKEKNNFDKIRSVFCKASLSYFGTKSTNSQGTKNVNLENNEFIESHVQFKISIAINFS